MERCTEVWKDIQGYEGVYQASNLGRIRSLNRYTNGRYGNRLVKGKVLKPLTTKKGYFQVVLCKKGAHKQMYVHRLVAQCFISNANGLPMINHKDENPQNNNVTNLEWCDCKYNINYGSHTMRVIKKMGKRICAINLIDFSVKNFYSMNQASKKLNLPIGSIYSILKGHQKRTGNYTFKYNKGED